MLFRFAFAVASLACALSACNGVIDASGTGDPDGGVDAAAEMDASRRPLRDAGRETSVDLSVSPADAAPDLADMAPPCNPAPYPLVLHHGFFGFESLAGVRYWYRVADALREDGHTVFETTVDPFNDSLSRATQLATEVDSILATTNACKVVVIAHSQGGVDARALVSRLGYADRVASLFTIATPHRGTRVAQLVDGAISGWAEGAANFIAALASQVLQPGASEADLVAALRAMSPAAMDAFNAETPDDPRVPIFSVGGRSLSNHGDSVCRDAVWPNPSGNDLADPLLLFSATYLKEDTWRAGKANDGMVTVESAKWGTFLGCIPADHFDEIGQIADSGADWISGFNHIAFYRSLVGFIRSRGE